MALDATEYVRIRSPSETKACTFLSDPSSTLRTGAKIIWVWLLYDDAEVAENQFPGPFSSCSANGRIRPGYAADLVVFDPDQIEDNATYAAPLNPPSGIAFVFVNGVIALDHGKTTDKNAGRPITRMN
jgi:hypothetical protein